MHEERDPDQAESKATFWTICLGWLRYVNNILLLPMFALLVIEVAQNRSTEVFDSINQFFCAMFMAEWALGLALAEGRVRYLRSPANIADFVSSLPFSVFAQGLRVVRLFRLVRIARLATRLRRVRGKSAKMVRAFGLVGSLVLTGALAFRIVEPESTESLEQALWWSVVTLSTVGYGDIAPTTAIGHLVASVVIFAGIGVFGYMAGFMTSLFDDPEEDEILETVRRLETQIGQLTAALESVSGIEADSGPLREPVGGASPRAMDGVVRPRPT